MKCGCKIVQAGEEGYFRDVIEFCPLHAAAEQLKFALEQARYLDAHAIGAIGSTEAAWRNAQKCQNIHKQIDSALAAARGEK